MPSFPGLASPLRIVRVSEAQGQATPQDSKCSFLERRGILIRATQSSRWMGERFLGLGRRAGLTDGGGVRQLGDRGGGQGRHWAGSSGERRRRRRGHDGLGGQGPSSFFLLCILRAAEWTGERSASFARYTYLFFFSSQAHLQHR